MLRSTLTSFPHLNEAGTSALSDFDNYLTAWGHSLLEPIFLSNVAHERVAPPDALRTLLCTGDCGGTSDPKMYVGWRTTHSSKKNYPFLNNIAQDRVQPRPQLYTILALRQHSALGVATEVTKLHGGAHSLLILCSRTSSVRGALRSSLHSTIPSA